MANPQDATQTAPQAAPATAPQAPPQGGQDTAALAQIGAAMQSAAQPANAAPTADASQAPAAGKPVAVQPGTPHAGLLNMIQSLALGVDAFATSAATHGREGGVEEVQQVQAQKQAQQIQAQKAQQEQEEHDLRMKTMNANLLMQQMQYQQSLMRFPVEMKNAQLELQNNTIDEFTKEKSTGESMGYDMADPAQAQEARMRMGVGSAAQQPGALTVPFAKGQNTQDVMASVKAALPPGASLTDYKILPSYADNQHGAGGQILLVPNNAPIMQMPATPRQIAASEAEVEGMLTQAKSLGLSDNDMFQRLNGQYSNIKQILDQGGKPTTSQLFQMHQSIMGPLAKLVADTSTASKLASEKAASDDAQIKAQQTTQANLMYQAHHTPGEDFATWQARQNAAAEQAVQQGDPNILGQALAAGLVAPSQVISARSMSKAFYTQVLAAANNASMASTGKPFNLAEAETQYSYAKNPQTQNVLNMIEAMNVKGGSIDIAMQAAQNLPKFNQTTLNKVFNATASEFGSAEASNFHTAMLGLADEYSKVMGGGVSSDSGRQQALDLLRAAYSKGQMNGAVQIMRQDIVARKAAIVRDNPTLRAMYPDQGQTQNQPQQSSGHKIGDPITQNGQTFRVTQVDANGKVLAADPVQP